MKKNFYFKKRVIHQVIFHSLSIFCSLLLFSSCDSKPDTSLNTTTDNEETNDTTKNITGIGLELLADSLTSPVALSGPPDNSGRLLIVDQIGLIKIITKEGKLLQDPFLDIQRKIVELKDAHEERGLLGLAFHPDYENNGRFFVYYSAPLREEAPDGWDNTSHISEFKVSTDNPDRADPNSEKILMYVDEPQDNHNAGTLAFGPDDYLYISLGDGGGADDKDLGHVPDWYERNEGGNGQDMTTNLLGSILRIDVNNGTPYGIPTDNPFVDKEGMDEVFAYGLRNPYRFSFDMGGNNELFVGDAGQALWEEIDIVSKGGNYGWNVKEATHCFDASNNKQPLDSCPDTDINGNPLINPIIELKTGGAEDGGQGLVIIGGYVYRGENIPGMEGRYVFGVWTQHHEEPKGAVFIADRKDEGLWDFEKLQVQKDDTTDLGHFLLGFGQNNDGEMYVLTTDKIGPVGETGKVYKIVQYN